MLFCSSVCDNRKRAAMTESRFKEEGMEEKRRQNVNGIYYLPTEQTAMH